MSKRAPLEGEVTEEGKTSSYPVQSSSSDALDNNAEEERGNPEVSRSKRKYSDITACLSLQSLIPPQGRLSQAQAKAQESKSKGGGSRPDNEEDVNWDAIIARCKSHPHEARESYFKRSDGPKRQCNTASQESNSVSDSPIIYKPLHAACKCDPPLEAVEAILHAHPSAALDNTFEGTSLKIAAENRVSLEVLRLLLVAELAMYKKLLEDKVRQQSTQESNHAASGASQELSSASSVFYGKNPINWICQPSIPVKTVGTLLTWLPWGAFKRPSVIDGALDNMVLGSPLIEIIDAFARDQDDIDDDDESSDTEPEEKELYESDKSPEKVPPGKLRTIRSISSEKKRLRRWKKFLHILFATDRVLHPAAQTMSVQASMRSDDHTEHLQTQSEQSRNPDEPRPFRPVHALMRCITYQYLGLELCRPYGVWFILQEMTRLIPQEFVAHEESDGRTPFHILAESQAADCRLCHAEIKDILECLMDADHRTAFSPRLSDGRLLGHVAVENGWPCKDLLATKTTASCA